MHHGLGFGDDNLFDSLLDGLEAGRKQRRWYGAPSKEEAKAIAAEKQSLAESARAATVTRERDAAARGDAVLVVGSESEAGAAAVTALVVRRANVAVLVRDEGAAAEAFGPYITTFAGSVGDGALLGKALLNAGAKAVVTTDPSSALAVARRMTTLIPAFEERGAAAPAVIALNAEPTGLGALLPFGDSRAEDEAAAADACAAAGVPFVSLRVGALVGGAAAAAEARGRNVVAAPGRGLSPGGATLEDAAAALTFAADEDDFDMGVALWNVSVEGDECVLSAAS
eukprot:PRCOL_00001479-RA